MSFGISATDVWHGIQLCHWIHRNYIHRDRPASGQYGQFVSLIQSFAPPLEHLHDALNAALESLASPILAPGDDRLRRNSETVIGDFEKTLQQSCALLMEHGQIREGSTPSFWDRNRWVFAQSDVNTLTQRITVHVQQISFILGPINLQMTRDSGDAVFEILHRSREQEIASNPCQWPEVPSWIADVFSRNLQGEGTPFTFVNNRTIPLHHGCSALHTHVLNSTYQIRYLDEEPQTIDHYVNLLKARWLVSTLSRVEALEQLRPASVFPRFISNMRDHVFKEFGRHSLVRPSNEALQARLEESPASFAIWPRLPPRRPTRRRTDPEADEDAINLTTPLSLLDESGVEGSLLCFRKRDNPGVLRFVPVAGPDGRLPDYQSFRIDTRLDRFVPVYTTDYELGPKRVKIYHSNDAGPDEFIFKSIVEAWAFQRVVTGYQVVWDGTSAEWFGHPSTVETISGFVRNSRKPTGAGRVQVWYWNPWKGVSTEVPDNVSHVAADNSSSTTLTDSSPTSNISMLSGATSVVESASAIAAQQGPGRNMVQVISRPDGGAGAIALKSPIPPALVCFQEDERIFTMFHIQTRDLIINPSACQCAKHPSTCSTLVLESPGETFLLSILPTPSTSLCDWNLSIFGRSTTSPSVPSKDIRRMKCKHLTIVFPSAADRIRISDTINEAKKRFGFQEKELAYMEDRVENKAEGVRSEVRTPAPSRRGSTMTAVQGGGEGSGFLRTPSPVSTMRGPWSYGSVDE